MMIDFAENFEIGSSVTLFSVISYDTSYWGPGSFLLNAATDLVSLVNAINALQPKPMSSAFAFDLAGLENVL